jgi:hypothetical protein
MASAKLAFPKIRLMSMNRQRRSGLYLILTEKRDRPQGRDDSSIGRQIDECVSKKLR